MSLSKAKSAVLGGLVGDAASMPLHWIYENAKLLTTVGDKKAAPEFFEPPSCPFYSTKDFPGHYQTGQLSPYGEQMFGVLDIISKTAGNVQPDAYVADFKAFVDGHSGYVDHATKGFVANVEEKKVYPETGADDNQAQCFAKASIAVAKYGDKGLDVVKENLTVMVRAHQNTDVANDCAATIATILYGVAIEGKSIQEAWGATKATGIPAALKDAVATVESSLGKSGYDMLWEHGKTINAEKPFYGLSCGNPQAFMGFLHTILTCKSYEEAIRANLLIGGDNCSRATAIGAVFGASEGVPEPLVAKYTDSKTTLDLLSKL